MIVKSIKNVSKNIIYPVIKKMRNGIVKQIWNKKMKNSRKKLLQYIAVYINSGYDEIVMIK